MTNTEKFDEMSNKHFFFLPFYMTKQNSLLDNKINGKFKMSTKLILQIYAEESLKVYQYMKMSFIKYD